MTLAVGLVLSIAAALVPLGCLIALLVSVIRWSYSVGPPPAGDDGGSGGMRKRPRAPGPHGGPDRRCRRRATLYRSGRRIRTR